MGQYNDGKGGVWYPIGNCSSSLVAHVLDRCHSWMVLGCGEDNKIGGNSSDAADFRYLTRDLGFQRASFLRRDPSRFSSQCKLNSKNSLVTGFR